MPIQDSGPSSLDPTLIDFMPTYEYRCPKGHEFELFQRMSDEPRAPCPKCGAEAERLLSAGAGFLFKGEGFYITDSRPESYREAAKAEKGDKKKKEGSKEPAKDTAKGESSGAGDPAKPSGAKNPPSAKPPADGTSKKSD